MHSFKKSKKSDSKKKQPTNSPPQIAFKTSKGKKGKGEGRAGKGGGGRAERAEFVDDDLMEDVEVEAAANGGGGERVKGSKTRYFVCVRMYSRTQTCVHMHTYIYYI